MTAMPMLVCENCGHDTPTLNPCPCGLDECRIAYGVCARCRRNIERNAIQRRRREAAH